MKSMIRKAARLLRSEDGPTAVEYAVCLALVGAVALVAAGYLGQGSTDTYDAVAATLESDSGGSGGGSADTGGSSASSGNSSNGNSNGNNGNNSNGNNGNGFGRGGSGHGRSRPASPFL